MDYQAQFESKDVEQVRSFEEECAIQRCFGWTYSKNKRVYHGRGSTHYYVFTRKKTIKNHEKLVSLEKQYYIYEESLKHYSPITDSPENFLLILIFIFPFIIYYFKKKKEKEMVEIYNASTKKKMENILEMAKKQL